MLKVEAMIWGTKVEGKVPPGGRDGILGRQNKCETWEAGNCSKEVQMGTRTKNGIGDKKDEAVVYFDVNFTIEEAEWMICL